MTYTPKSYPGKHPLVVLALDGTTLVSLKKATYDTVTVTPSGYVQRNLRGKLLETQEKRLKDWCLTQRGEVYVSFRWAHPETPEEGTAMLLSVGPDLWLRIEPVPSTPVD